MHVHVHSAFPKTSYDCVCSVAEYTEQLIVSAYKQISVSSSEKKYSKWKSLPCALVCLFLCERVCGMVAGGGYKDPSVGEIDHKPPEQLILSL